MYSKKLIKKSTRLVFVITQFLLSFFMNNSFAQQQEYDVIVPRRISVTQTENRLEKSPDIENELVVAKRESVISEDSLVPKLAMQTLIAFREDTDILITVNNNLESEGIPDIGQANRRDYLGKRNNECVVSFNEESRAFSTHTNNNIFVRMNFSNNTIKEFIFLHEFAHCHDGELSPQNIDSIEWREALADGYAIATLLDYDLVNTYKIDKFKQEREKYNAVGSVLILGKIMDFYNTEIKDLGLTPVERLDKIKKLRKSVFEQVFNKI